MKEFWFSSPCRTRSKLFCLPRTFSLRIGLHLSSPFIARIFVQFGVIRHWIMHRMFFGSNFVSLFIFFTVIIFIFLFPVLYCTLHHYFLFSPHYLLFWISPPPLTFAFYLSVTFSFCLRILTSICFILPCFPLFPPIFFPFFLTLLLSAFLYFTFLFNISSFRPSGVRFSCCLFSKYFHLLRRFCITIT